MPRDVKDEAREVLSTEALERSGGGGKADGGGKDVTAHEKPRMVWADGEFERETWRSSVKLTRKQRQKAAQRLKKRVV